MNLRGVRLRNISNNGMGVNYRIYSIKRRVAYLISFFFCGAYSGAAFIRGRRCGT